LARREKQLLAWYQAYKIETLRGRKWMSRNWKYLTKKKII